MPSGVDMSKKLLDTYIGALTKDRYRIVRAHSAEVGKPKVRSSSSSSSPVRHVCSHGSLSLFVCVLLAQNFSVNLEGIMNQLRRTSAASIVAQRFGAKSARIVRLLLDRQQLELKAVSDLAMIPLKETRLRLYKMYGADFVRLQSVPKRAGAQARERTDAHTSVGRARARAYGRAISMSVRGRGREIVQQHRLRRVRDRDRASM